jgi:hypothetical protein
MSSIQFIHDNLKKIKHVIVCVDPVDLDNIWQCLFALVRVPQAHIHIVLSPRVLDLQVPTFADQFEMLIGKLGPKLMLNILREDVPESRLTELGLGKYKDYFRRDTTFQNDPHTKTHIPLYMSLSALRFAKKFNSKGHVRSRYTFYFDPKSMDTIVPGIRHPTHVNDYLYACNAEDRDKSKEYLHLSGPDREMGMVSIMKRTRDRLAKDLGFGDLGGSEDILHPIEDLVEPFDSTANQMRPLTIGGGPFTEMVRILEDEKRVPLAIVAMARTWWADTNIFPNNYNDLLDLDAAQAIEKIARGGSIPTWFFPTECAKSKVRRGNIERCCHWDFSEKELEKIFWDAHDMESFKQAKDFTLETKTLARILMFDVLAMVPLAQPQ